MSGDRVSFRASLRAGCSLRLGWHCRHTKAAQTTDLYKVPDAVPPIYAESYHVATDKVPAKDGDKFWSIISDSLHPIATHGKKARSTLLVDQHCGNGCSIKRALLSVRYYNEISGGHIGRAIVRRRGSAGPVLPLWHRHNDFEQHCF